MNTPFLLRATSVLIGLAGAAGAGASGAAGRQALGGAAPLVIAHRGASGCLPEHTLAGHELAIKLGADCIEPDPQLTNHGCLVAMHDTTLDRTTDVAAVLGMCDGNCRVANDTLAEIRQLTVKPVGTAATGDAGFTPSSPDALREPTFDEVIRLAQAQSALVGRTVGLYPEARTADVLMEDKILSTLASRGCGQRSDRVIIQSFSLDTLKSMRTRQQTLGMDLNEVFLGNSAASTFAGGLLLPGWTTRGRARRARLARLAR